MRQSSWTVVSTEFRAPLLLVLAPPRIAGSSSGAGKALDCMYIEYFFPTLVAWARVLAFWRYFGALACASLRRALQYKKSPITIATTALPHSLISYETTRPDSRISPGGNTETIIATTVKMKLNVPTNQTPAFPPGIRIAFGSDFLPGRYASLITAAYI